VEAAVQDLASIEVCLNVSALQQRNVAAIFEYAAKGVLYPLQPLYDRCERPPVCASSRRIEMIKSDRKMTYFPECQQRNVAAAFEHVVKGVLFLLQLLCGGRMPPLQSASVAGKGNALARGWNWS